MLRLAQARNKPAYKRYEKRCAQYKPYRQQRRRDYHFHFFATLRIYTAHSWCKKSY